MTKNILILMILLFISLSCSDSDNRAICDNTIKRVYVETYTNNLTTYYQHYILLPKYSDVCFNSINFSQVAKQYVDTCTFNKPVRIITFLKSIEDETDSDTFIPSRIMKHELIEFRMDSTHIKSIHIVKDGLKKKFMLNNCELKEEY